jgi:RNA polymerase sigma-70 factor (ECF subfamily)
MARLSPEHRVVLGLVYYRSMSILDVSKELGIPAGVVRTRAYYALRALRLVFVELGVTSSIR